MSPVNRLIRGIIPTHLPQLSQQQLHAEHSQPRQQRKKDRNSGNQQHIPRFPKRHFQSSSYDSSTAHNLTSNKILENVKNERDLHSTATKKQQKNAVTASEPLPSSSLFVSHAVVQPATVVIHAEHTLVAAGTVFAPPNPLDFARGAKSLRRNALSGHDFDVRLLEIDIAKRRGLQFPAGIDGPARIGEGEIDPEKEIDDGGENVKSGRGGKRGNREHSEKGKNEKTENQHAREEQKGEIVVNKVLELVKNSMVLELA